MSIVFTVPDKEQGEKGLPQFVRDLVACPPRAGDGVHFWIFKVARQLHAHRSKEDIFCLIKAALDGCGRVVKDLEIWNAIKDSEAVAWRPNGQPGIMITIPKLQHDFDFIDCVVRSDYGLNDLWEQSPVRFEDGNSHAEFIIDTLFPGNPLLCLGKTKAKFATRRRETWRGRMSDIPLVVPNPMIAAKGLTQGGKQSEHTKEATGRRVYQAIEFDFSEKCRDGTKDSIFAPLIRAWKVDDIAIEDACAAVIFHLAQVLPTLVVACFSGGKSLHAWFRVFELSREEQDCFMDYAIWCGADPATKCKSQFVRVPDGMRDNGVRQTAYYLDPGEAVTNV